MAGPWGRVCKRVCTRVHACAPRSVSDTCCQSPAISRRAHPRRVPTGHQTQPEPPRAEPELHGHPGVRRGLCGAKQPEPCVVKPGGAGGGLGGPLGAVPSPCHGLGSRSPAEHPRWVKGAAVSPRCHPALRAPWSWGGTGLCAPSWVRVPPSRCGTWGAQHQVSPPHPQPQTLPKPPPLSLARTSPCSGPDVPTP